MVPPAQPAPILRNGGFMRFYAPPRWGRPQALTQRLTGQRSRLTGRPHRSASHVGGRRSERTWSTKEAILWKSAVEKRESAVKIPDD